MPLSKNQIMEMEIAGLSSDGNGVGRAEGMAVFVPGTAPGDRLRVRIVKVLSRYAFGRVEEILTPGPGRVAPDCPAFGPCGGCALRQLDYAAECEAKTGFVRDAFSRLGGLSVAVSPVVPAPDPDRYRNKVQLPVGRDANGRIVTGFYAGRSHRIVPCRDCQLQPEWMNALAARACALFEQFGIEPYGEEQHTGLVRHLYLRQGWHSGQRLLCFVLNGKALPHEKAICAALQQEFGLTTVLVNENTARTNVILGENTRTVLGPGVIEDTLAGVPLRMGVHEFYQVNTPAAEALAAIVQMAPRTIVMVSCNPATAARDTRILTDAGYAAKSVQPFDLFPRTKHVETVVLLSKGEIDSKKVRVEFSLEDMDMSGFQKGATYEQIKAYVLEKYGLKVSSLYISQIKRKCGLDIGQNYNLSKKEDAKVPQCPLEKEAAIMDALKHFQMI